MFVWHRNTEGKDPRSHPALSVTRQVTLTHTHASITTSDKKKADFQKCYLNHTKNNTKTCNNTRCIYKIYYRAWQTAEKYYSTTTNWYMKCEKG